MIRVAVLLFSVLSVASCGARRNGAGQGAQPVVPGISVLLRDSVHLIEGKRLGLLTNQTGIDEHGVSDIDLLTRDARATQAGAKLVRLFSPEHGIRGTENRSVPNAVDERSGLPIISLYSPATIAPPDSLLRDLDALVFDLQDVGTRTWTYVGNLVYALRAAKRTNVRLIVLDRPNPITGARRDGPMLDSALANPEEPTAARPGRAYALYPFPLRHGMTMGEMARFYNTELAIDAKLTVVPVTGWRRDKWFDQTGLPWVKPSPNLPSLLSELIYPALVAFEGSNVSVGRGTPEAFQHFGAPWLKAGEIVTHLTELSLAGVTFEEATFTPSAPSDGKYSGVRIPAVRIHVTNRDRLHTGRLGAAILWAVTKVNRDSLRVNAQTFDLRFGSPTAREALMRGDDPDTVIDAQLPSVVAFERRVRQYLLYR